MNPTIWEYLVFENPSQSQLTALGQQGWELVAVTCTVSGFARSERAFLKHPKPDQPPVLTERK